MKVKEMMTKLELRFAKASMIAGFGELVLRYVTGYEMFGFLGVGLILLGATHFLLIHYDY